MESLLNFLHSESLTSLFRAELCTRGGYITFSNSGRRGDTKYFQIGIDSLLTTLKDMLDNLVVFSGLQDYDEKTWRDNGSLFFTDAVANANSTVQTKPLFSTLSKVIKWANQPNLDNVNTDNHMRISGDTLNNAIIKLNAVADSFTPHIKKTMAVPPLDEPLQIIYYGAPGTGKSHKIDNDPHVSDDNTIRTTFHPDSDYSTFVGAYKPTMAPMPVNAFVGTTVHHAKNADNEKAYEKKIVYKYVPQAFLKAYVAAWSDLDNPYFLVIEEINRGNCAQIFGDLFQLLDRNNMGSSSYAIHADEDITQFLAEDKRGFANLSEEQKNAIRSFVFVKDSGKTGAIGEAILTGKKLLLPPNLYIWATMNTSDQSLFPIDSAFKRRWNWEYMPIEYNKKNWLIAVGDRLYSWGMFLELINPEILELTGSADKQMGYFFVKADTNDKAGNRNIISQKLFINKVLFYLWTDVLKDYDLSKKPFVYEDENRKKHAFRFTDFFGDLATENLICFFDSIEGLTVAGIDEPNDENDKEFSVTFPDDTIVNADTLTDTYAQALQKIGFEQVAQFSSEKQYKNPLVTREKIEGLERPRRYKELDGWYILVGPDTYPYYTKLEMLNKELNLNLIIKHK